MKSTIALLALLIVSPAAYASKECEFIGDIARGTMALRQAGAEMPFMHESAGAIENRNVRRVAQDLVLEAFETPRFSSGHAGSRAGVDFGNKVFSECIRGKRRL